MNERIRELANEAWQYANNNSRDGDDTHGWLYRDKFAELIVQECIGIVEKNESDMHYDNGMYPVYPTVCEIREHFGVEE